MMLTSARVWEEEWIGWVKCLNELPMNRMSLRTMLGVMFKDREGRLGKKTGYECVHYLFLLLLFWDTRLV